eukprot:1144943-Pelagomonas_calceolata.AAC.4
MVSLRLQAIRRACEFVLKHQQDDGGWGESYLSCQTKGPGCNRSRIAARCAASSSSTKTAVFTLLACSQMAPLPPCMLAGVQPAPWALSRCQYCVGHAYPHGSGVPQAEPRASASMPLVWVERSRALCESDICSRTVAHGYFN